MKLKNEDIEKATWESFFCFQDDFVCFGASFAMDTEKLSSVSEVIGLEVEKGWRQVMKMMSRAADEEEEEEEEGEGEDIVV
ncbi:hypothetical protein H105_01983 [Trichophyton soudanense CBS 452.61]|uniref:Uncharacterized protein n=1 Tax=Trichophyton soudanense CBS 452.61 TaxID=1215331 RepID=A0A022Y1J6_TRISD|nr:hypothetical protein H105_01983 [Trichophyton soudanense CBS 452.61]EZG09163.1 hypothetical protein H106_01833 [Trichophyton rubrum CBS 735.88]